MCERENTSQKKEHRRGKERETETKTKTNIGRKTRQLILAHTRTINTRTHKKRVNLKHGNTINSRNKRAKQRLKSSRRGRQTQQ